MNRYSKRQLDALNGAQHPPHDDSRILYKSAVTGRGYGYPSPPSWEESDQFTPDTAHLADPKQARFVEVDPAIAHANEAQWGQLELDGDIASAYRDQRLSPAGRAERIATLVPGHLQRIANAVTALDTHGKNLKVNEEAFYAAPKVGNDLEAGLADREIRDRYNAMDAAGRAGLLDSIARGSAARVALALKRSPVPLEPNAAQVVESAWRAAVDREHPQKAAQLKAARAHYEWADSVARAAAQYSATLPGVTPQAIAEAVRGTGTEQLFNVDPAARSAA
jgi:hypothetical protein